MRIFFATLSLLITVNIFAVGTEGKTGNNTERVIGPYDSLIARNTARLLIDYHYLQSPLNDEIAARFLDNYVESLDGQRLFFLQSDVENFEMFRRNIPDQILREGNVQLAHMIYDKFLQRLEENHEYVNQLLDSPEFDFTRDEEYLLNRREAERPKSLAEARELWRKRVKHEYLSEKLADSKPEEIVEKIKRRYTRIRKNFADLDGYDVLELYLSSLTRAYDPHSDYLGKHQLKNFEIQMKLSLFGIGALLSSPDGTCEIVRVIPGGPAEKSNKIHAKDKIVAVAQGEDDPVDVVDMPLRKVVELIRGKKGTEVRLTIIPHDATDQSVRKVVPIVRDEIPLEDQEAKAKLIEIENGTGQARRLGVIDLPSFYADFNLDEGKKDEDDLKSTTRDVTALLQRLKKEGMEGLVLDLRRNGGGSLEEAVNLTGLFIKKGPVVIVKDTLGRIHIDRDTNEEVTYDGPMIVLTSRFSASASEILAGALQDYGRALIVGEASTHGKGTVQSLLQLNNFLRPPRGSEEPFEPGALKVTIRKFYRPNGHSTQLRGVIPDLIYPSINNHAEIGEDKLKNPLPWDIIPEDKLRKLKADFVRLDRVSPYLSELKTRLDKRLAGDRDWEYVQEDIERFKEMQADKTVSLNEQERVREKEEAKARSEARREEITSRDMLEFKTYELTLKNVEGGELPEAKIETDVITDDKEEEVVPKDEDAEKKEEEKTPRIDLGLKEAKRILLDWFDLKAKDGTLTVKSTTEAPVN